VARHNYIRWRTENRLTLCRGELALARGDGVQALALAEDAMGQASPHGATKSMHLAHDLAGRAPATLGKTEEAMIRLEQAVMGAAAIEYRAGHWRSLAHLADVLEHAGQVAAAEDRRAAARAVIGTIAQGMRDPDSRTASLAATSVPAALTHPAR
jgi:hypothetical protein